MTMVWAFAPATVSNLACGFDVLGFALEGAGDRVGVRRTGGRAITLEVRGDGGRLPREVDRNTAGVAILALLERTGGAGSGLEIVLEKGLPLGSGLGSSAASAVAAVVAADRLLGTRLGREVLLDCALEGERAASGARHADNAAPSLWGGLVLVQSGARIVPLPAPAELWTAVVRPEVEVATREARAALPAAVPLADAVAHFGWVGGLVASLFREDWALLADSLVDRIAEPVRAAAVPGFEAARAAALETGALGSSLSGSGPSVFGLCRGERTARAVATAMAEAFERQASLRSTTIVSRVAPVGARIVPGPPPGES